MGEYAASNKVASEQDARELVARTFGSLQDYDFELFQAIRNQQPVQDSANAKLRNAVAAFDKLLATVPQPDLSKAKVKRPLLTVLAPFASLVRDM